MGAPRRASRPKPFLEALTAVAKFLGTVKHPSAIIGGVAVIAHGFARSTIDIDATIAAGTEALEALIRTAARWDLSPRMASPARSAGDCRAR